MFSNLLRFAGFKSVLSAHTLGYFMLERAFMLVVLFRELLALGFGYRVGGRSIRRFLNPNVSSQSSFFTFFCNLVSRSYAGSLVFFRD